MPAVTRLGDLCTGHGCFPPRPSVSASPNVFVNGIPVCRVSDRYAAHGCSKCPPHPGNLVQGSATVFVNGMPVSRVGDALNCGSSVMTGSPNVFIGDTPYGGTPSSTLISTAQAKIVDTVMASRAVLEAASVNGDMFCKLCNQ